MSPRRPAAPRGFTLVEMLVALVLLAGLGLLLAGALQTGGGAWRRSRGLSEDAALRDAIRQALDRQLGQAQPVAADPRDDRIDFLGEPDAITFLGPLPEAIAQGVMARQRLAVLPEGLALAWQLPGDAAVRAVLPVLEDVTALHLGYWSPATPEARGGWRPDWRDRTRLPGLVAIEIIRLRGAPISILVAPRVTATPACLYDPAGPACRPLP